MTFGFTDHDRTLSFADVTFEPESGFAASELRSGSDLAVDAQDAEGVLSSDRITETDILDGRWDNAEVEVWRVNWADTAQRVLMRRGAIGQIRRGRLAFVAEVRSLAHVLGQTVGRTFQATCDAALGDARSLEGGTLLVTQDATTGAILDQSVVRLNEFGEALIRPTTIDSADELRFWVKPASFLAGDTLIATGDGAASVAVAFPAAAKAASSATRA